MGQISPPWQAKHNNRPPLSYISVLIFLWLSVSCRFLRCSASFRDAFWSLATTLIPNTSAKIATLTRRSSSVCSWHEDVQTLSNDINKRPICLKKLNCSGSQLVYNCDGLILCTFPTDALHKNSQILSIKLTCPKPNEFCV